MLIRDREDGAKVITHQALSRLAVTTVVRLDLNKDIAAATAAAVTATVANAAPFPSASSTANKRADFLMWRSPSDC